MTPDKRLNQLEPLVGEISAQLDRVTAQNRQVTVAVGQLTDAVIRQSDNIQFLLHEVAEIKIDVGSLKAGQDHLAGQVDIIIAILQTNQSRN